MSEFETQKIKIIKFTLKMIKKSANYFISKYFERIIGKIYNYTDFNYK